MTIAEAFALSLYVLLPGWLALGIAAVCLVVAAWPPKRNRRIRR